VRRWSSPSKGLLVLGVALGALAFVVMRGYAGRERALERGLGTPTTVVVATVDASRGAVLSPAMLSRVQWPSTYTPPSAVRDPRQASGRILLADVDRGQVLTTSLLAPEGGAVASLIPQGLRAVAVPSSLPRGAVSAGDHVDVLATFPGARAHVETVATGLEVLRVLPSSGSAGADAQGSSATLLVQVEPSQAEELAYARAFAAVSIALDAPQEVMPRS